MKHTASLCRRGIAGALAASVLAVTLAGCGGSMTDQLMEIAGDAMPGAKPGETVSADSMWINSSVDGSIEKATPTNEKNDFYTAVNKEWLLDTPLTEDVPYVTAFDESQKKLENRLAFILLGTEDATADLANELPGLTEQQLTHDLELIHQVAALAEDEAARAAAGAEPARPYIDAVAGIDSMEEMTAFLLNEDGTNIALHYLVPFDVAVPYTERTAYVVAVEDTPVLTLDDNEAYRSLHAQASSAKNLAFEKARYLLERLGWSKADIDDVLHRCLDFEQTLVHNLYDDSILSESDYAKFYEMKDNNFTKAELAELQGNYPLVETLESCGMADTDRFVVWQPDYVRAVGRLYSPENLEDIKAYFLVHSIPTLLPLLDEDACKLAAYDGGKRKDDAEEPAKTDEAEDPAVADAKTTIQDYIEPYLGDPLQQLYVARYCTAEQKAKLQTMIDDIMTAYHTMLQSEEWMGEDTCAKAIEKLDNMAVRNLYPDEFVNYNALNIKDADNLVEAVAAIRRFDRQKQNDLIGQPIGGNYWDMTAMPTTIVNAMYMPQENSINLLAGLFSSDFFYTEDMTEEMLLGRAGTIIGHEISHAFDTSGSKFDSAGYKTNWWTTEDYDRYMVRNGHLTKDYGTQYLAPGITAASYGDNVNGEAVADMAGVKVTLLVAQGKPTFDYDAFFTAYAQMWRAKYEYKSVLALMTDEHPLGFLRCNKTLQQFDEFLTTYDIGPDNGMYLAPENRITVW